MTLARGPDHTRLVRFTTRRPNRRGRQDGLGGVCRSGRLGRCCTLALAALYFAHKLLANAGENSVASCDRAGSFPPHRRRLDGSDDRHSGCGERRLADRRGRTASEVFRRLGAGGSGPPEQFRLHRLARRLSNPRRGVDRAADGALHGTEVEVIPSEPDAGM